MTNFLESDFDGMKFNPAVKGKMIDKYPELKELSALCPGSDADKVIRYILMVYDDQSVLVQTLRDITLRKRKAAELCSLPKGIIESVIACSYPAIAPMVSYYMRVYRKQKLWQMIVTNEMLFDEYNEQLMQPLYSRDDDDEDEDEYNNDGTKKTKRKPDEKKVLDAFAVKSKLAPELDIIYDRLEGYYKKMFGDDDALKKKVQTERFTPEGQAAQL